MGGSCPDVRLLRARAPRRRAVRARRDRAQDLPRRRALPAHRDETLGRDVVLLGGTPTDLDWLELYDLGCAISRAGARSLSIVMPYFGYSTMERAVRPGEVVTAKTRARSSRRSPGARPDPASSCSTCTPTASSSTSATIHVTHHLYGSPLVTAAHPRASWATASYVLGATDAGPRQVGAEPRAQPRRRAGVRLQAARLRHGQGRVTGINADVRGRRSWSTTT
jgi:ribose-phosphate pyrophosphokinase